MENNENRGCQPLSSTYMYIQTCIPAAPTYTKQTKHFLLSDLSLWIFMVLSCLYTCLSPCFFCSYSLRQSITLITVTNGVDCIKVLFQNIVPNMFTFRGSKTQRALDIFSLHSVPRLGNAFLNYNWFCQDHGFEKCGKMNVFWIRQIVTGWAWMIWGLTLTYKREERNVWDKRKFGFAYNRKLKTELLIYNS